MKKPTKRASSPRFTDKPRDVPARVPLESMLSRERAHVREVISENVRFTSYPAAIAYGAYRTRKGGLSGKITSCPTVSVAFQRFA